MFCQGVTLHHRQAMERREVDPVFSFLVWKTYDQCVYQLLISGVFLSLPVSLPCRTGDRLLSIQILPCIGYSMRSDIHHTFRFSYAF